MGIRRGVLVGAVLCVASSASAAPLVFSDRLRAPLPADARALAVVDVDADGWLDLAAADASGGVAAWLNASAPGHSAARVVSSPAGLVSPGVARSGDFDGDGGVDLLVTTQPASGSCTATLVRGMGDGSFAPGLAVATATASAAQCTGLEAADFDGDGNLDVALVYFYSPPDTYNGLNGAVEIWLGRGAGVFVLGERHELSDPGGLPYYSPATALVDLDDDGALDLVFAAEVRWLSGPATYRVQSLRGDGTGHFSEGQKLPFACPSCGIIAARAADVTGDGLTDVVVATAGDYYPPAELPILLFENDGAGGFAEPQSLGVAAEVKGLELADVTADGQRDLVLFRSGSLGIWPGSGASPEGLFGPAEEVLSGTGALTSLVDVDADGRLDLVSAVGRELTLASGRRRGPAFGLPPLLRMSDAYASFSSLADVDGDGALDVVAASYGRVDVLINAGAGRFVAGASVPTSAYPWRVPAVDVDGDGAVDLVLPDGEGFALARGLPGGSFDAPAVEPGAPVRDIMASAWGDVDDDGDHDLLVYESARTGVVGVYLQSDEHQLVLARELRVDVYVGALQLGDLDGDGALDLLVNDWGSTLATLDPPNPNRTAVWLGDRTGGFSRVGDLNASGAQLAELNGDGALDLLTPEAIWAGRGDGTFDPPRPLPFPGEVREPAIADFNGDGHLDLAANSGQSILVATGDGSGSFGAPQVVAPYAVVGLVAADLGGDGLPDLLTTRREYLDESELAELFLLINQTPSPSCGPAAPR